MKKMLSKNTVICFIVMAMALLLLPYNKVYAEEDWRISCRQQEYPVSVGGGATLAVNVSVYNSYTSDFDDITNTGNCTFQWYEYTGGDIYDTQKLANDSYRNEINGATGSTYTVNNITTTEQYICLVTYNGQTRSKGFSVYPDNGLSVKAVDDEDDLKVEYDKDAKIAAYVYAYKFDNMVYKLQKQNGSSWEDVAVNIDEDTVSSTCHKITYTVKSTIENKGKYRIIATDCYDTAKHCDFTLRFALKVNYSPDVSVQSGKDVTLTVKPSIDETVDNNFSFLYSWSYDGENTFKVTDAGSLTLKNVTKNEKIYCSIVALDGAHNNSGYACAIFNIKPTLVIGTTTTVSGITFKVNSASTIELTKAPTTKSVTIPDTVVVNGQTLKVTSIAANAFKNNKKVTQVVIGKNVTKIGKNAFYKCTKLKTVKFGNNVTKIGANAFYGCKKLKTITIKSAKLTSKTVEKNAFKGLTKATTIKVPKKKLTAYKKLFKSKGLSSKVKVKGY